MHRDVGVAQLWLWKGCVESPGFSEDLAMQMVARETRWIWVNLGLALPFA